MTALEVGLVAAVALLAVLAAALLRAQAATARRVTTLERRLHRERRREEATMSATSPDPGPGEPGGDAVDIRGTAPDGTALTIALEGADRPTLLAFLSTSCGICTTYWTRLRDGELAAAANGIVPVVVTKDAALEDLDRIRALATDGDLPVLLSGEAWDDYEVPGSPYFLVVSARPGSVVAEGAVSRWEDIVAMVASATVTAR